MIEDSDKPKEEAKEEASESEQEKHYRSQREKSEKEEKKRKFKESFLGQIVDDLEHPDLKKIFFLPFKIIAGILKIPYVGKIILLLFILFIVSFGWAFLYSLLTGGGVSVFGTQLSVLYSSTPIKAIITPIYNFYKDPVGTIAQFGTFKPPETVEKRKPQGVEFRKFETKRPIHKSGEEIETVANVKIYGLEDNPTTVTFNCKLEDVATTRNVANTLVGVVGETQSIPAKEIKVFGENEPKVTVSEKREINKNVECKFSPIDITADLASAKKQTVQRKLTLTATYEDFKVNSRLKIYTLESSTFEKLESENINPFNYFKISDPLVSNNDQSVRSEQLSQSPGVLILTLLDAQPLTSDRSYLLGIELSNDKLWNGKIAALKELKIKLPQGFSFENQDECKGFRLSGDNTLIFNQAELNKLNEAKINTPEKIDKERLYCEITLDSSAVTDSLDYAFIEAEAKFDYDFEAYAAATISNSALSPTLPIS